MEQAVRSYIYFILKRARLNADQDITLKSQSSTREQILQELATFGFSTSRQLSFIVYDTYGGGLIHSPENKAAANNAYNELFAFCMSKLESANPENPVKYLCEVVFKNKFFYEDYLTLKDYYKYPSDIDYPAIMSFGGTSWGNEDTDMIHLGPSMIRLASEE